MTKDEALTDSQCDEFRRLPMSFNDMVRAIYKAGQEALEQPTTEQSSVVQEPKSLTILARLPNGATASNVYEAYEAGLKEGKAETQEPVAWMNDIAFSMDKELLGTRSRIVPLYTHPAPAREWVGLSAMDIEEATGMQNQGFGSTYYIIIRAVEAKLKEKNNG